MVQDVYESCVTGIKCTVGEMDGFEKMGLNLGSYLSAVLCAMVMESLMDEIRQDSPLTIIFEDDVVISASREQVEESLENRRYALKRKK